ncbi:MAG TPA: hypothetical protein PLY93_12455 [Turneriella sp.]|nr:hypothetical protein [Turneriella sp.]
MKSGVMNFMRISFVAALALMAAHCATPAHYQYQRTVPGADGTVYVQTLKIQPRIIYNSTKPVILNCKLRGENLNCDRELQINIDSTYWQAKDYFQKEKTP